MKNEVTDGIMPSWWNMIDCGIAAAPTVLVNLHRALHSESPKEKMEFGTFLNILREGPWAILKTLPTEYLATEYIILRLEMPIGVEGCKRHVPIETLGDPLCRLVNYSFIEKGCSKIKVIWYPMTLLKAAFKNGYIPPAAKSRTIELLFDYTSLSNYNLIDGVWGNYKDTQGISGDNIEIAQSLWKFGFHMGKFYRLGFKEVMVRYD